MEGFWSRAFQGQICGSCRRCLRRSIHTNARRQAVTRRPTVLRNNTRRKAGPADMFTALYTTIMASAAVADAASKGQRRKELDQRLEKARQDLASVLQRSSKTEINQALASSGSQPLDPIPLAAPIDLPSPYKVVEGIKSICVSEYDLVRQEAAVVERSKFTSRLHQSFGLRRKWADQKKRQYCDLDEVAAALTAEEATREVEGKWWEKLHSEQREPQTPTQFDRMVMETCYLTDDLLTEAYRLEYPNDPDGQKNAMDILDSPWRMIFMLRSEGYPKFQHPSLDPDSTAHERIKTNAAIWKVFEEWEYTKELMESPQPFPSPSIVSRLLGRQRIQIPTPEQYHRKFKVWVAKICYSLLVAKTPPGIHNYNALILGFTRIGEPSLAQMVVDSFLLNTHFRPTQQTIVCLLHHYRAQNDIIGFYRLLRRLVGFDARGLKIRRRVVGDAAERTPATETWLRRTDIAVSQEFFLQRATVDSSVVQAVIVGLRSFDHVRQAAIVFASFLDSCRKISTPVFLQVLNDVLDSVDVYAAQAILKGLVENVHLITPLLLEESEAAGKLMVKLRLLHGLALASPCHFQQPTWRMKQQQTRWEEEDFITRLHSLEGQVSTKQKDGAQRLSDALFVADTHRYLHNVNGLVTHARQALSTNAGVLGKTAESWGARFEQLRLQMLAGVVRQRQYQSMANVKAQTEATMHVLKKGRSVMLICLEALCSRAQLPSVYRSLLRIGNPSLGLQAALLNVVRSAPRRKPRPVLPSIGEEASRGKDGFLASLEAEILLLERFASVDMTIMIALFEERFRQILFQGQKQDRAKVASLKEYWRYLAMQSPHPRSAPLSPTRDASRVHLSFMMNTGSSPRIGRGSATDSGVLLPEYLATSR